MFIISTPLNKQVTKHMQRITSASDFSHCTVVSVHSQTVNEMIANTGGTNQMPLFGNMSRQLKLWMRDDVSRVNKPLVYLLLSGKVM